MDIVETLKKAGVVPVIVIEDEAKAVPLARALVKGGLPVLEVTFRTKAAAGAIAPAAACVRNVTSRTGSPPFTSARASGTAFASSSITITGTTPAFLRVSTISINFLSFNCSQIFIVHKSTLPSIQIGIAD